MYEASMRCLTLFGKLNYDRRVADAHDGIRARRQEWMRTQILAAAWELVRDEGLSALSMRVLAEKVGMRAPSLYTYFPSKNELFDAMYAQGMRQFAEQLRGSRPGRTPRQTLRNRARAFVGAAVQDSAR